MPLKSSSLIGLKLQIIAPLVLKKNKCGKQTWLPCGAEVLQGIVLDSMAGDDPCNEENTCLYQTEGLSPGTPSILSSFITHL